MNTALAGHYAQEYIISVDSTLVNSEACSLGKHSWCFLKPQDSTEQSREKKSYCGLKRLRRLKRHHPKPVPTFGLDCVPCLFPSDSLSVFPRILSSCDFICSLLLGLWSVPAPSNWGYTAGSPLGRLWHWDWAEPTICPTLFTLRERGSPSGMAGLSNFHIFNHQNIRSHICLKLSAERISEYQPRALS